MNRAESITCFRAILAYFRRVIGIQKRVTHGRTDERADG